MFQPKGKMVVLTAPSGAGKTTLVRHLLNYYGYLDFSVSATTRAKREHEQEGVDYFFLSEEEFRQKIEEDAFVEWEEVYNGQYYGTLRSEMQRIWEEDKAIVFDIDVNGASKLKEKFGEQCLTIFVKPPSIDTLVERLKKRATETEASLIKRIDKVKREIGYENRFDAVIVNDLLEVAKKEAEVLVDNFIHH
ncbi:MAG TPA: guanylate kinase [Saprospiraceae bacterium]|nr:guanylate kinase [Saprospiraceae bacterium]